LQDAAVIFEVGSVMFRMPFARPSRKPFRRTLTVMAGFALAVTGAVGGPLAAPGAADACTAPLTSPSAPSGSHLLSLERPAFASTVQAGTGNLATNVDDGSLCSGWESTWNADPQWVYVDLGAASSITQVVLTWDTAYATAFSLQTSNDQVTWTTVYSTTSGTGGTETIGVSGSGRYLRVLGQHRYFAQYGYMLDELQVYGTGGVNPPPDTRPDLAQGKPAAASSQDTTDGLAASMYLASNVTDGDASTCWTSANADDQWISVDLGAATAIGRVAFTWFWPGDYARAYDIQVSGDGVGWTTVYRQLAGDGGTNGTGGQYGGTETVPLDVSGRYVRMYEYGRQQNHGLAMCEFGVYGWASGDPAPSYAIPPLPTPGVVAAGAGSYATNDVTQLTPNAPKYITANITGPIKSNTWWTSLLVDPLGGGNALVPLPLKAGYSRGGLGVYNPGAGTASADGGAVNAGGSPDLTVDTSAISHTQNLQTLVNGYGDYSVNVWLTDDGTPKMSTTMVEGSPFVYDTFADPTSPYVVVSGLTGVQDANGNPVLAGDGATYTGDHIGVTLRNTDGSGILQTRYYGLFAPAGTVFTRIGSMIAMNLGGGANYLSIATLPSMSNLAYLYQHAYAFVTGTTASYAYDQAAGTVSSTFTDAVALERSGFSASTLMGLEPHQVQTSSNPLTAIGYPSVRGPITLSEGDSFATSDTFTGLLPQFAEPDVAGYSRAQVLSYLGQLDAWLGTSPAGWISQNSEPYWQGKVLQQAMQGALEAKQIGDTTDLTLYLTVLRTVLDDFYTYSSTDPLHGNYFEYNSTWGALTPYTSAYGLNVSLNDHHLTYGYFVYASAVLASFDPAWAQNYGPMVQAVLNDYADPNRGDGQFPTFRNFDPYAGHSWAGGYADNPNGANQESSSEALQSWAAEYLWGVVTGNQPYTAAGAWGFTTELRATQDYYFNWAGNDFLPGYTHAAAGQIYGSSYWFGTYFGAQPSYVYGIQMLPTEPWLAYDGVDQTDAANLYTGYLKDNGGPPTLWQHILLPFQALTDPAGAMTQFTNSLPTMESQSIHNTYWFIQNMASYGHPTQNVWATNSGTTQVFVNGSTYTAQVWNPTGAPVTVTFRNAAGTTGSVTVGPGLLITTNPMQNLGGDSTAPSTPGGLTATTASTTQVNLSWTAATDNVKVQQYAVYRDAVQIATTPATSYSDTGLTPLTAHAYTVKAEDEAGNLSAASGAANATTQGVETPLDESHFTAGSNAPYGNDAPQNAITNAVSGNAGSANRFATDTNQAPGLYYQVDMGTAQTFNQIRLNATGGYAGDYAPGYQVQVSNNTSTWTTVATSTGNTAYPETATFAPQTDRYIRVTLTGSTTTWWSLVQFFVDNRTSGPTYPANPNTVTACGAGNTSGSGSCVLESPLNQSAFTATSNAAYGADIPQHAITNQVNGTSTTRFATDTDQAPGLYYQVDMGSAQTFNELGLDSGGNGGDYARAYTVTVSNDGATWTTLTPGVGTGSPQTIPLPTTTARYVRVTLNQPSTTNWWSIAVFTVYHQTPGPTATTNTSGNAAAAIDGNPTTRFTSGAAQTPGMYWQVNLGAPTRFDTVAMDSSPWPGDYAHGYQIQISADGATWTTVATTTATGSPQSATFPEQSAQYIRVSLTTPVTPNWWSIGEFTVYDR
jgi:endoglucanase Acf2